MRLIERRLGRLEQLLAERVDGPRVCNCRLETRFHSGVCLAAILAEISWACPVHSIRTLGYFRWVVLEWEQVTTGDEKFCPCARRPEVSWPPDGGQSADAEKESATGVHGGQGIDLEKDGQLMEEVVGEYAQARMEWCEKTGRQLPTEDEIAKVIRERKRNYG